MYDYDITATFGSITVTIHGIVTDVHELYGVKYIRISASRIDVSGSGTFDINNYHLVGYNIYNTSLENEIAAKLNISSASAFFRLYETEASYDWTAGEAVEWFPCDLYISGSISNLARYLVQGELGIRQYLKTVNIVCDSIADATSGDYSALGGLNGNYDIRSLALDNSTVDIQCNYIGDYALADSAINSAKIRSTNYGGYLFYGSELVTADMDPEMTIQPYTYYLCQRLTQFNTKDIDGKQFINYVNNMVLDYNFYGCNNVTIFTMGDDLNISNRGASKEYETWKKISGGHEINPYIDTVIYTDNPNVIAFNANNDPVFGDRNNGFELYFHRPATLHSIHNGVWYIAHQGQWLVFNPQEVTDNNCVIMKHKGQYIKYKLVLPSDPKASPVYCKHNNKWMCLAYN